jgi:hypothetical protein
MGIRKELSLVSMLHNFQIQRYDGWRKNKLNL